MSNELPGLDPLTRRDLILFDLTRGLPVALRVLRKRLGWRRTLKVLTRVIGASWKDPLRDLPTAGWNPQREALTRHQLRGAVRLDDALQAESSLEPAERLALLRTVISETGAAFLERAVPIPSKNRWQQVEDPQRKAWTKGVVSRLFNAEIAEVTVSSSGLGFDVGACRFAQLATALERPWLAPLFCEADSVFFDRPEAAATLTRTETIAQGAKRCDFRFEIR